MSACSCRLVDSLFSIITNSFLQPFAPIDYFSIDYIIIICSTYINLSKWIAFFLFLTLLQVERAAGYSVLMERKKKTTTASASTGKKKKLFNTRQDPREMVLFLLEQYSWGFFFFPLLHSR